MIFQQCFLRLMPMKLIMIRSIKKYSMITTDLVLELPRGHTAREAENWDLTTEPVLLTSLASLGVGTPGEWMASRPRPCSLKGAGDPQGAGSPSLILSPQKSFLWRQPVVRTGSQSPGESRAKSCDITLLLMATGPQGQRTLRLWSKSHASLTSRTK